MLKFAYAMKSNVIASKELKISLFLFLPPAILDFFKFPMRFAIVSIIFVSVFIYYMNYLRFRRIAFSFPAILFLALMLYHCANAFNKEVPGFNYVDVLHGLKLYSCLIIISYWAFKDFIKTTKILLITFIVRCAIVLLFSSIASDYSEVERITGIGGSATGLGQTAALTGIFIVYYNVFKKVGLTRNLLFFILPIIVIILSQTRNALAMIMISIFTTTFLMVQGKRGASLLRALPILVLTVVFSLLLMSALNDTHFGQRFQSGFDEAYNHRYSTGTFFDVIVGDRIVYYIRGWEFFLSSPITGIGMHNYKNLTGGIYPLHSEFMVQLCEGGIIGSALWLLFILFMFFVIMKYIKDAKIKIAAASSMIVLLFCAIYAREFWGEAFYPIYGLILAWYYKHRDYIKRKRSIRQKLMYMHSTV